MVNRTHVNKTIIGGQEMPTEPMFYDGNGEKKQVTSSAKPQEASVTLTPEIRKSLSGNPYVFVK
jgi:hypothetical protein